MFPKVLGVVLEQKTEFDWWDFKGKVFYPLELVCKVEYCRTEKQDGVMVVGLRISEVDVRVSIYSGKGVVCTKKVIKVLVYKNPPPHFLILVCVLGQPSPVRAL